MSADLYVETEPDAPEVPLVGGDVTEGIVRIGGTVRKPLGAHSPLVHALLRHLEAAGFAGAPRFLGVDAAGREVLTFIEGEVAGKPRPAWQADEGRLASVGRLVRAYDDAALGFVVPDGIDVSGGFAEVAGMPPAPDVTPELIGHMDWTPDNMVFRDGVAHAVFDFDIAKPAARVDELYNVMLWWAPLQDPQDRDEPLRDVDAARRARILADAYGMTETDRRRLVEVAVARSRRSWFAMRHMAQTKGGGWARMWADGVGDAITRRVAWLEENGAAIEAALLG